MFDGSIFDGVMFSKEAQFSGATITGIAQFIDTTFGGDTDFARVTPRDIANFHKGRVLRSNAFGPLRVLGLVEFRDATSEMLVELRVTA